MFSLSFWKDTFERAVSTAAQAVLTLLSLDGTGVVHVNVQLGVVLATAGFGALYAVLKALVASQFGNQKTASFTDEVVYEGGK